MMIVAIMKADLRNVQVLRKHTNRWRIWDPTLELLKELRGGDIEQGVKGNIHHKYDLVWKDAFPNAHIAAGVYF